MERIPSAGMKSPWEVTENPGPIPCRILPEKKHIPLPMLLQQKKSIKKTDAYNTATVNGKFPSQSHVTLEPGTGDGIGKMTKTAGTVEPTEDGKYVPWEATLTIRKELTRMVKLPIPIRFTELMSLQALFLLMLIISI
mgnify:CR=1 FL=1